MAKEEGTFTVSEEEITADEKEIISVAEGMGEVLPMGFPGQLEDQQFVEDKPEEDKNWLSSGKPEHFIIFLTNEMQRFPKPMDIRGNTSKMEQSLGQWKRLNNYISKALREDYDDVLDIEHVDQTRAIIEQNIEALEDMLEGISELKRNRKKMKRHRRAEEDDESIIREAGVPHFQGFQMLITPFQRAIAGALINGKVSGGRNMEELWTTAKKKYGMNDREELEILQILADMGYPEFKDRLRVGEEKDDPTRTENHGEWQSQYYG